MTRFMITGLITTLLITTASDAQENRVDGIGSKTGALLGAAIGGHVPASSPTVTTELIKLLDETQSVDTFVVIMELLQGKDAKQAVPAIIRNAERLGIFSDVVVNPQKNERQAELAETVMERIGELMEGSNTYASPGVVVAPPGRQEQSSAPVVERFPLGDLPKRSRIVIYSTFDEDPGKDWIRKQQRDLTYLLRKQLTKTYPEITIVPVNKVESLRMKEEEDPTVDTIISRLKADYVIRMKIHKLDFENKQTAGEQAKVEGRISLLLSVIDGREQDEDPLFEEEFLATGSEEGIGATDEEWKAPRVARDFLKSVAGKIADRFRLADFDKPLFEDQPAEMTYDRIHGGLK